MISRKLWSWRKSCRDECGRYPVSFISVRRFFPTMAYQCLAMAGHAKRISCSMAFCPDILFYSFLLFFSIRQYLSLWSQDVQETRLLARSRLGPVIFAYLPQIIIAFAAAHSPFASHTPPSPTLTSHRPHTNQMLSPRLTTAARFD